MGAFGNAYIGCLLSDTKAVFAVSDEKLAQMKIDSCFLLRWQAGEFLAPLGLTWVACSLLKPDWPGVDCVAIGANGALAILFGDGTHRIVERAFGLPTGVGAVLRSAALHRDGVWAVGSNYTCVELDQSLRAIDRSPTLSKGRAPSVGFESVCSVGDTLYCGGWNGEIWSIDSGHQWSQESTPTNMIISSLCASPEGTVHGVGQAGTLITGRAGQWRALPQTISENLWSCVWFEDTVYAASSQQLFMLADQEFCTVELPDDPASFFHLSVRGPSLLSAGANDLLLLLPDRMLKLN